MDRLSECITHCESEAHVVWWRWSTDRNRNTFSRHAGYQNNDWTDPTKGDLRHGDLNKRSIQMQISLQQRQSPRLCADFSRSLQIRDLFDEIVTVRFINHQCRLNQNQCVWSQHQKRSWTLPRCDFARQRSRDSRSLLRPGVFTAHRRSTTCCASI